MKRTFGCEDLVQYLSEYLDHHLEDELAEAAREHLQTCRNCRVVLDSTERTILLYREQGAVQQLPADRQRALYDRLAAAFLALAPPGD